jgi:hypothetical protein
MFDALCDRKVAERRARQLLAGTIAAAIYNVNRDPEKSEPITAIDFVPDLKRELEAEKKEQTLDEMIEVLSSVMGCGPGR